MADINRYKDPNPQNAVNFLTSLDEDVDIDVYRRIYLHYGKNLYQFEALKWDVYLRYGEFLWTEGNPETGLEKLKKGEGVVVSEVFANQTGLYPGKQITKGSQLRQTILEIFDETFAVTTVLLLIALVVAALGITSALTVSVLERGRELNTIFAVGGSFGQIRAMIFWEALLMVFTGKLLGMVCGFILSYLLIFVVNKQSFGWTFSHSIDWLTLIISYPMIILAALCASIPAIKLVFRQPPATLLREPYHA